MEERSLERERRTDPLLSPHFHYGPFDLCGRWWDESDERQPIQRFNEGDLTAEVSTGVKTPRRTEDGGETEHNISCCEILKTYEAETAALTAPLSLFMVFFVRVT